MSGISNPLRLMRQVLAEKRIECRHWQLMRQGYKFSNVAEPIPAPKTWFFMYETPKSNFMEQKPTDRPLVLFEELIAQEGVTFGEDDVILPLPLMPHRSSFIERYATKSSDTMESILSDMEKKASS